MKSVLNIQMLGVFATCVVTSGATVFAAMHFAYGDFETQRVSDVYRSQIDQRLVSIEKAILNLDKKISKIVQDD